MKPAFQFSRQSRRDQSQRPEGALISKSLATDWAFQSTADLRVKVAPSTQRTDLRPSTGGLYALTLGAFEQKTKWEDRIEGVGLTVVVALAAWPIIQAAYTYMRTF